MINKVCLIKNIEALRERLCQTLTYLDPTDLTVVNISQELDKYIVLYEKSKCLAIEGT
ncbi:aspartyl-phosphate phosphatase Spo0E family protein [Clostridium thermarum]|uniref:aspartyl-phosphate phosphatase Spo0E family protein n=1 Tax=Clostridium thermarum TaxID=1716543 RepID=UPI0013D5D2BF|nr:aspartyl-phosphate phosphatase Spo0E family protein [Clostridium thermarum]